MYRDEADQASAEHGRSLDLAADRPQQYCQVTNPERYRSAHFLAPSAWHPVLPAPFGRHHSAGTAGADPPCLFALSRARHTPTRARPRSIGRQASTGAIPSAAAGCPRAGHEPPFRGSDDGHPTS